MWVFLSSIHGHTSRNDKDAPFNRKLTGSLENGWLAGIICASYRWNHRLALAVIALCTPSVSQMAYPTEITQCDRAAICFSLASPNGRPSRSCPRRLCGITVREDIEIISTHKPSLRPPLLQFSTLAQMLAGSDWLFLRFPEMLKLLPLSSRKLLQPGSEMARDGGRGLRFLGFAVLEPKWRSVGGPI